MSHVFISYSHQDAAYRDQLLAKVKEAGFEDDYCWYDERNIEAGEVWNDTIDEAIDEAYAIVVIMTSISLNSPFVTYEWSRAIGYGIGVIPVIFDDLSSDDKKHPLPQRIQYIDLRHDEGLIS